MRNSGHHVVTSGSDFTSDCNDLRVHCWELYWELDDDVSLDVRQCKGHSRIMDVFCKSLRRFRSHLQVCGFEQQSEEIYVRYFSIRHFGIPNHLRK